MSRIVFLVSLAGAIGGAYIYLPMIVSALGDDRSNSAAFAGLALPLITYVFARSVEKLFAPAR